MRSGWDNQLVYFEEIPSVVDVGPIVLVVVFRLSTTRHLQMPPGSIKRLSYPLFYKQYALQGIVGRHFLARWEGTEEHSQFAACELLERRKAGCCVECSPICVRNTSQANAFGNPIRVGFILSTCPFLCE